MNLTKIREEAFLDALKKCNDPAQALQAASRVVMSRIGRLGGKSKSNRKLEAVKNNLTEARKKRHCKN